MVMAFVDVIEFGDGRLHGGNWILAFVEDLMRDVRRQGVAVALEDDPRQVLSDLAYDLSMFWAWMADGNYLQNRHPGLFAKPPATPEQPAEPETPTSTTSRPQRQRALASHARRHDTPQTTREGNGAA